MLTITERLRAHGVVESFVEFFGEGLSEISLSDRATVANMAPEYGATMGFFPVDAETLSYLRRTGRSDEDVDRVEAYTKRQGLFRTDATPDPEYTDVLELDLGTVEPSLAGPKRPQDRVALSDMQRAFRSSLTAPVMERGFALEAEQLARTASAGNGRNLGHGAVVIAAITSCTNTSNPGVMLAAGLLAQRAVKLGLTTPDHVKTSLAPGSKAVTEYLRDAGLLGPLADLGFHLVGYGCTTCIGNSGPLPERVERAIESADLVAASVLSGNRNFEGRVHPSVRANYLASPPLVVAYALAGTVDIDLEEEPLGTGADGNPVFLRDIWPTSEDVREALDRALRPETFRRMYGNVWDGNPTWNEIPVDASEIYPWDEGSTYIQEPPFFSGMTAEPAPPADIRGARVLVRCGDSVTTDHISPAGTIAFDSPAGSWLRERGIERRDFNSYGSRRGNDRDHAPRHLREHPVPEPARRRRRGRLHGAPPVGRADHHLRRREALPRGGHPARDPRRQGVRDRLLPRLGRQGNAAPGRQGGDRRELRAHPPQQPGRHGRPAARVPGRRERRIPWSDWRRGPGHRRREQWPRTRRPGHGDCYARRPVPLVPRALPPRLGGGGRLLPERRHPADGDAGPGPGRRTGQRLRHTKPRPPAERLRESAYRLRKGSTTRTPDVVLAMVQVLGDHADDAGAQGLRRGQDGAVANS